MKTVYCYVENESKKLEEFLEEHDADSVIHLYTSFIESCEGNLFFCLGDMLSKFWQESEKCWIVTDSRELFELLEEICSSLFEKIIFLDDTVDKICFDEPLDTKSLLRFSIDSTPSEPLKKVVALYFEMLRHWNLSEEYQLSELIQKVLSIKEDWHQGAFLAYIGKLFLHMSAENTVKLSEEYRIFTLSLIMQLEKKAENTNAYIKAIMSSDKYEKSHYYFVWNQFKRMSFTRRIVYDKQTNELVNCLYDTAYQRYCDSLLNEDSKLLQTEREKKRVLVLTIQFLGMNHAPTKTVSERCQTLRRMGMEVYLVNTTEQYIGVESVPLYESGIGTVCDAYNGINEIEIYGEIYPFCQLRENTLLEERFRILKQIISEFKPYYILSIGTGSLLADLVGNIVPCIPMALVFSTLPHSVNPIRILGRTMTEEEKKIHQQEDIIESRFTFRLNPQKNTFTREELHIPEDKFILVVVGIRLTYEVTDDFLELLEYVCEQGCFVVFAGLMENYEAAMRKYSIIGKSSEYIGYCDDILALMELCDLYVNPKRQGGGFSVIEAFTKGKPGVYLSEGDVYAAGGSDFAVADFQEMREKILRYKNDDDYYQEMSELAKQRAEKMTDSLGAMQEIDEKIRSIIEEKYW